ncbi:MAG: formylglycine-generating enzyme family protein, partial [Deltaproteobacteria bacterium]|nr:formylglycine-generating enzyme family protein [Deltaproteobacteria bacterium]
RAETEGWAFTWNGAKWEKLSGIYWDNPGFSQTDSHPVTCVSWNDAREFITWLNRVEPQGRYRLPTEAEWEYAARGGTATSRHWGDEPDQAYLYGNVADQAAKRTFPQIHGHECDDGYVFTAPVGSFAPNQFGLYDMIGNVWEWCQDYHAEFSSSPVADPMGPSSGSYRVFRGGSWTSMPSDARSAARVGSEPDNRNNYLGFRLARTP